MTTGVRLGELCGLQWPDVDLAAGTLTVRRALARDGANGWALAEPKTTRSRRTIPLAAAARSALEDQRARQDAARAAVGEARLAGSDGRDLHGSRRSSASRRRSCPCAWRETAEPARPRRSLPGTSALAPRRPG